MKTIKLFRYNREDGGVTVSPEKPEGKEYTEMYRVIADEGMLVTQDGENKYPAIDTDTNEGWYEVEDDTQTELELEDNLL